MLIYAEDFAAPYWRSHSYTNHCRFGADANRARERWYPDLVPYAEMRISFVAGGDYEPPLQPGIAGNTGLESGRKVSGGTYAEHLIHLPRSRSLTQGMLFYKSGLDATNLKLVFRSNLDNSETHIDNFEVSLSIHTNRQKATINFATGGSGYPDIPNETVYYDFTQPFWLWIQCDMPADMTLEGNGACRVWLNNDLVVTKEDILTGDIDAWASQPLYGYNNVVCIADAQHWEILSLAAVNEGLGYMDSALGDINVAGLLPESAEVSQWYSNHDGDNLETSPEDVMLDNLHTDYADLHTKPHIRADDHMVHNLFRHQNPFTHDAHIMAVSQRIVHRKYNIGGGSPDLRIEPMIQTSGRPAEMDRNKGQSVSTTYKTLVVNYTVPYAGAYWSKELLDLTTFGFAYFNKARNAIVHDQVDLLGEYDVENIDDGFAVSAEAGVGVSEELNEGLGLAVETTAGDEA